MATSKCDLSLPFIRSACFGLGVGVISTSPDVSAVLGGVFGLGKGDEAVISSAELEQHRSAAAKKADAAQPVKSVDGIPGVAAFAEMVRLERCEWVVYQQGTAVRLAGGVEPIRSLDEFAASFGSYYPFHRVKQGLHENLMTCWLLHERLAKEKALRATRSLLAAGYPVPGVSADHYTFVKGAMSVTWVVDEKKAPLGDYLGSRWASREEMALLGITSGPAVGEYEAGEQVGIRTIVEEPRVDKQLLKGPLTIAVLDLPPQRPTEEQIYRSSAAHGIENRRLDYMFPVPVAVISPEGKIALI